MFCTRSRSHPRNPRRPHTQPGHVREFTAKYDDVLVVVPSFFSTALQLYQWGPSNIADYNPNATSLFWRAGPTNDKDGLRTWPQAGNANTDAFDITQTGFASSFDVIQQVHEFFLTGPGAALFPNFYPWT